MPNLSIVADSSVAAADPRARRCGVLLAALFRDPLPLHSLDDAGAAAMVRDLGFAICDLIQRRRLAVAVPTEATSPGVDGRRGAVWEVGLERDGDELRVSVFRQGYDARIAQGPQSLSLAQAKGVLDEALAIFGDDPGARRAREALGRACDPMGGPISRVARHRMAVRADRGVLSIEASAELWCRPGQVVESGVFRTDLHALLTPGQLRFTVGTQSFSVGDEQRPVFVFLAIERLVELASVAVEAKVDNQGVLKRLEGGGLVCGLHIERNGRAMLMVASAAEEAAGQRLPPVDAFVFASAVVSLSRRLTKQLTSADESQRNNLRVQQLRRSTKDLLERLTSGEQSVSDAAPESELNPAPEHYLAFAESEAPAPPLPRPSGKLRFEESWRADVPNLDVKSVLVSGSRVFLGSPRELSCLERRSGALLWSQTTRRSVTILTPAGIVRLSADGHLHLHRLADGEVLFRLRLEPCVGASASGAVVAAAGLPTMLLLAEGARHLAAIDLDSGEIRWRRMVRQGPAHGGKIKIRRAGKLVVVGDQNSLFALDLLTGEVVWRHRGQSPYLAVTSEQSELYALSLERRGLTHSSVERIEPWSGQVRWRQRLPRGAQPASAPHLSRANLTFVTRGLRRGGGQPRYGALAFDRASGALRYDRRDGLCEGKPACIAVDDLFIANSSSGELVALNEDGELHYRHVFATAQHLQPEDQPRSFAPVLRSGALFLPQSEVYAVKPHDGGMLARLPCDLVPDAVVVDDQGGVYIAEASGYVAAYHAAPMLTL
ncbi:MAG: PQQ-binding-like beta-propeller repeat protein, partial [Myxococcota bacterium]